MPQAAAPKLTMPVRAVLQAFLDANRKRLHGFHITRATGLQSSIVYPILERLEGCGYLESFREDPPDLGGGLPQRRYYLLTDEGRAFATSTPPQKVRPVAIDPPDCACTECICGEYVPLDQATPEQIAAMLTGRIANNTNSGTHFDITIAVHAKGDGLSWNLDPALLGITIANER